MLCAWTCCFVAEQVEAVGFAKFCQDVLFFHRNVHDALDKFVMVKWQTTVACGFDSVVMWNFLQNHGMRRGICLGDADSRDALIALLPCRLGYTARQIDYTNLHKPHGKPSLTPWSF